MMHNYSMVSVRPVSRWLTIALCAGVLLLSACGGSSAPSIIGASDTDQPSEGDTPGNPDPVGGGDSATPDNDGATPANDGATPANDGATPDEADPAEGPTSEGPSAALSGSSMLDNTRQNPWFVSARQRLNDTENYNETRGAAKNVIVFVGDGMGISTVTAARILQGQNQGLKGEENNLSFDQLPFAGLSKTYTVNAQTADSAGTMTAIISGVKTDSGLLGVDEDGEFGRCDTQSGNELVTALELAEIAGMSTGIVSTASVTHATPAAAYAKSVNRGWENDSAIPSDQKAQGCVDIARQLVEFEPRLESRYDGLDIDGLEVVMGGGRRHFLPADESANSSEVGGGVEGRRADGRNLVAEWQARYSDGVYITDQSGFDALDASSTPHVFGLFQSSHMRYEANRSNDVGGEPGLAEMTGKAIDVLKQNNDGFFLVVESGRIDHGHHVGSAYAALTETIQFSDAVAAAMQSTDPADTLILVTADHSHVFTMGGVAKRGNPILGKSVAIGRDDPQLANDGLPYTTLAYGNGRGFRNYGSNTDFDRGYSDAVDAGRKDLTSVDTTSSGFHQETLVPLSTEAHGAEDVSIHASGPGASLIAGTIEQNVLFHVFDFAADLSGKANAVLNR